MNRGGRYWGKARERRKGERGRKGAGVARGLEEGGQGD